MLITFYNETFPEQYDPQINANAFEVGFISALTEKVAFIDRINSQLGEFATINPDISTVMSLTWIFMLVSEEIKQFL